MLKRLSVKERDVSALHADMQVRIGRSIGLPGNSFANFTRRTLPNARQSTFEFTTTTGEIALDRRGAQRPVVQISAGRGWRALLGAATTWSSHGRNMLAFVDCQLIVFLQQSGSSQPATQFLRLEWEALDGNAETNFDGEIAHPHWQVDLGGFDTRPTQVPAETILTTIPEAKATPDLRWSSRLHMAASARWMNDDWTDVKPVPHVHGPQSQDEVRAWMVSACRYMRDQIAAALSD